MWVNMHVHQLGTNCMCRGVLQSHKRTATKCTLLCSLDLMVAQSLEHQVVQLVEHRRAWYIARSVEHQGGSGGSISRATVYQVIQLVEHQCTWRFNQ